MCYRESLVHVFSHIRLLLPKKVLLQVTILLAIRIPELYNLEGYPVALNLTSLWHHVTGASHLMVL